MFGYAPPTTIGQPAIMQQQVPAMMQTQNGQIAQYCPPQQQQINLPAMQPPMIPAGVQVVGEQVIPPSQAPRTGNVQLVQFEYYDHLLYGFGQLLRPRALIFSDPQRNNGQDLLTNFTKNGELSDGDQAEVIAIYSHTYFNDPEGVEPPADAVSASRLYDLFNNYTFLRVKQQKSEKAVLPLHRVPAGGGISGFDVNAAALVKTQGVPTQANVYRFDERARYFIANDRRFFMELEWMSGLPGGTVYPNGYNPLEDEFNPSTTAEKLARFGMLTLQVRDDING